MCTLLFFDTVSATGTVIFSEVKSFLQKQPDIMIQCKSIATLNKSLILTGNHLVFARKKLSVHFNPM